MDSFLKDAILNGLFDKSYSGYDSLSPRLLSNGPESNLWQVIKEQLQNCCSFVWSVAFITEDMLVPLKQIMADLNAKGVQGKLFTGTYLSFNSPKTFQELQKIPNLQVNIVQDTGFHAKGFFFEKKETANLIIGSANFTRNAMLKNKEWSIQLSLGKRSALYQQLKAELTHLASNSLPLTVNWLADYRQQWTKPALAENKKNISREIVPNLMQKNALHELQQLISRGGKRGLIVSATGTGKTYLSAFAARNYQPQHFLYIVHREQITRKTLRSFKNVLPGLAKDFGLLSGSKKQGDRRYVFATIQTLAQDAVLHKFKPQHFDYIVIDEAHRAAAASYQKVLSYFKPKFCLGMTATPERMDNLNVYQIFDYNLVYEISLREALVNQMLVPFHFVGVQDYVAGNTVITDTSQLSKLTASARVHYVLRQIDYYGYCGQQAKGIVFCSRQKEAQSLAQQFSRLGHLAIALTNQSSQQRRLQAIKQLKEGKLEYIITVDLFNEGVDIPELNQIIMLRNTKSSIVFTQQLGRGLRKYPGKSFVTVLDFIGNYRNNYLIPLALNGDRSGLKDQARQETLLATNIGLSTINFSRVASEQILRSLERVKLDGMRQLKQNFTTLRQKIGRTPLLFDFYRYDSISPLAFVREPRLGNYYDFLRLMDTKIQLNSYEDQVLSFITKELTPGKRIHELLLLQMLLQNQGQISLTAFEQRLKQQGAYFSRQLLHSVLNFLSLDFFTQKNGPSKKQIEYGKLPIISANLLTCSWTKKMQQALANSDFRQLLSDAVKMGLALNQQYDNSTPFTKYAQYTREEVCHLLNWPQDVSAPMYGYRTQNKQTPIFITYQKINQKRRNALYRNELSDGRRLHWYTRSPRHLDSAEVQKLLAADNQIFLFVKRSDAAGKDFYYLGPAQIDRQSVQEEKLGLKKKPVVGMDLVLDYSLNKHMYDILFAN